MRREPIGQLEQPASRTVRRIKTAALVSADLAAAVTAAVASYWLTDAIRAEFGLDPIALASQSFKLHLAIIGAFTLALMIWFSSKGHYRRRQALADQLGAVLGGAAIALLCSASMQFATIEVGSRMLTLSYWALMVPLIVLARLAARRALRSSKAWSSPAVLFTCAARSAQLTGIIKRREEIGAQITSVIATNELPAQDLIQAMKDAADAGSIVIYAPSNGDCAQAEVVQAMVLEGTPFILSPQIGPLPDHAEILQFPPEDFALVEVHDAIARPFALMAKRSFDIIAACVVLIALAPLLVPIALAIRADGGPVFFRQKRVGRGGEVFDCLKFRSMVVGADERLAAMIERDPEIAAEWKAYQKLKKDPRITWVGRFIRKTNLDELPQVLNVLRGEMSLVGPRPMTVPQIEEYGPQFAAYVRVRPGITGLWQTNGRNETTFAERARLDAWYVRNWSLWRDTVVLVRTVREVVLLRGN